jgi:ATP-dependent DNA helicase RecG
MQAALDAKYRLSFEEMLLFMTALVNVKKENSKLPSESFIVNRDVIDKYISSFDFNLTGAQKKVINEILNDMQKPVMMNRLLQGDVGSGKTIPASVAMLVAKENGKQSALMAPTDILASQHYDNIQKHLGPFGLKVALLKSRMPQAEKREILKKIKSGEIHAVIGTHALIQKSVEYNNLGMVVTDEQHRFGVAQRARISAKGNNPDTLVMSATPVPRTLALILYGDLDISIIDEMPKGRLPVKTRIIDEKKRMDMYAYIKEHLQKDNRAYIVCPLIEESDKLDVKSTEELVVELKRNIFKDIPVEVLHGKMKNEEKESIMQKFRSGKIKCLISTTVIEVGVDVPEASFMVIENAERFGLSQLHQLRGRVGRSSRESWCFLVTESEGVEAKKRLKIMTKSNDGFVIAEEDLKMRGPGQFMGFSQSGMMDPRVINLMGDYKLLAKVKDAMEELTQPKYADEAKIIRAEAMKRYEEKLRDIILN